METNVSFEVRFITCCSSVWSESRQKKTGSLQIVYSYSLEFSTVHLYGYQRRDQMQRKANGRAHMDLFLYQVLMASELSLSVLSKVCVGLGKNPGVAAGFSINQELSIPKDAPVHFGV